MAVFLLTFGLLLSDFMSRQVLAAVLPFLKVEWALSDTQLGGLSSIVALTVGLNSAPRIMNVSIRAGLVNAACSRFACATCATTPTIAIGRWTTCRTAAGRGW